MSLSSVVLPAPLGPKQANLVAAQNGGAEVAHTHFGRSPNVLLTCVSSDTSLPLLSPVFTSMLTLPTTSRRAARLAAQLFQAHDACRGAGAAGFHAFANPHLFLCQQLVGLGVDDGLLRQLFFLLHQVGRKVAGIAEQLAPVQLDDAGGHVVQKGAVVGNGDDGCL
jgi:hypothetical protein